MTWPKVAEHKFCDQLKNSDFFFNKPAWHFENYVIKIWDQKYKHILRKVRNCDKRHLVLLYSYKAISYIVQKYELW